MAASGAEISFLDRFTKGVYGEHARVNNDFNGGPTCAAQQPLAFTLAVIGFFVSGFRRERRSC